MHAMVRDRRAMDVRWSYILSGRRKSVADTDASRVAEAFWVPIATRFGRAPAHRAQLIENCTVGIHCASVGIRFTQLSQHPNKTHALVDTLIESVQCEPNRQT